MQLTERLTDQAVLSEIGRRLERYRIDAGLTQARLARESGISKRTLERIEAGASCELTTLIRLLRVLKLIDGLNALIPDLPSSPIALLKQRGHQRQRASSPRLRVRAGESATSQPASRWKWGE